MALALCLSGGAPQDSPQSPDSRDFLVGALLKNLALKGRIASDIQASDRELQTSERIFLEAENRMTIATETQNRQAEWEARGPLDKARSDLKKLKQARTRLDQAMARAEAAAAAISLLIPSGESADKPIWGLASLHSGKARVRSKSRTEVNLEVGRPRFLEPGDEVMTMGSSLAEIQALYGRATVLLGERARLGSEEDVPPNRALRLVQGRIYTIVDRQDEFAGLFQEGRFDLGADPRLEEAISRTRERTRELTDRRLIVRTPNACLDVSSVRCTVELSKNGAAEIVVLEGTVEAGDAGCSRMIPVEEGFMAVASEEGVSEPKKAAAIDKWWEK
jgi:hypothetical protein